MNTVIDNTEKSRFELKENGKLAIADYTLRDGVMTILHVEADPALRGTGAAARLMEGVLAEIRAHDLKVRPVCSYAVAYLKKHPEQQDLRVQ